MTDDSGINRTGFASGVSHVRGRMRTLLMSLCFVAVTPSSIGAQARIHLEVESRSWLDSTPFDALKEFTLALRAGEIEVVQADDTVPSVNISYEERAVTGYSPHLIPATSIRLTITVQDIQGDISAHTYRTTPELRGNEFPSAAELQSRAIATLREQEVFRHLGDYIGAMLGIESSIRRLLIGKQPNERIALTTINKLRWSPSNDELFVRAFQLIPLALTQSSAELYIRTNLTRILTAVTGDRLQAAQLSVRLLAKYGQPAVKPLLLQLSTHPVLGESALNAVAAIEARVP